MRAATGFAAETLDPDLPLEQGLNVGAEKLHTLIQETAAALAILHGFQIDRLTDPITLSLVDLPLWASWFFSLLWIVGVTNAINLLDGLDGLAIVPVMIAAIVTAVLVMMVAAGPVGRFVEQHPTIKMLALSFLILIGVALVGESADLHIPKGYIYFAMAFSLVVEMLNINLRKKRAAPVELHNRPGDEAPDAAD